MTVDTVNIKIINAEVKAMFEEDMKEVDTTSFNDQQEMRRDSVQNFSYKYFIVKIIFLLRYEKITFMVGEYPLL